MRVTLKNVRIAYAQGVFEAKQVEGKGEPKYSAAFLFPRTHEAVKILSAAIQQVATEKWAAKAPEVLKQLKAADRLPVHDGNAKPNSAGYEGHFFLNASNKVKPLVVDTDPHRTLTVADGKLYSGAFVNVILEIWPQDNNFGKRINAALSGVQFVRDGERLAGGSPATSDDFEPIPDAEGSDKATPSDPAALFA